MSAVALSLSDAETAQLIELYQGQENLYNSNHSSYYNRAYQRESLRFLRTALDKDWTEEQMRAKLKNLRTQYSRHLKKIRQTHVSGTSTDEVYKPTWKFFESLDVFLRPYCSAQKGISNMADQDDQADQTDGSEDIDLLMSLTQSKSMDLTMDESTSSTSPVPTMEELPRPMAVSSPKFLLEKKRRKIDVLAEALGLLKKITDRKPKREKTRNTAFADFIAFELEALPPEKQEYARSRFLEVLKEIKESQ